MFESIDVSLLPRYDIAGVNNVIYHQHSFTIHRIRIDRTSVLTLAHPFLVQSLVRLPSVLQTVAIDDFDQNHDLYIFKTTACTHDSWKMGVYQ